MKKSYRCLVVDDDPWVIKSVRKTFNWEANGFDIPFETTSSTIALDEIRNNDYDVVFTDVKMPKYSGLDLVLLSKELQKPPVFVLITGYADFNTARVAINNGVYDLLLKPLSLNDSDVFLKKLYLHLQELSKNKKNNLYADIATSVVDVERVLCSEDVDILELKNMLHGFEKLSDIINNLHSTKDTTSKLTQYKNIIMYLEENYKKSITLEHLADKFCFSVPYLSKIFKKVTGLTFTDYLIDFRLKKATKLLTQTDLSLEEISAEVGYNDYNYFARVFKKKYNISPMRYRNKGGKYDDK